MLLSEYLYCVALAFKMTEQVEQKICIKFCIKLKHCSAESIQMIQKAAAMGNWWLAASSWQYSLSCVTSCAKIFGKTSNHPGDSASLEPTFGSLQLLASPKTKITFEREEISGISEIQENRTGQPMAIGRTVWGPTVPALKGTEMSLSYVQCFLYLLQ